MTEECAQDEWISMEFGGNADSAWSVHTVGRYAMVSWQTRYVRIPRIVHQTMTIKRHDNHWCVMCGFCIYHCTTTPYQCIWLMESVRNRKPFAVWSFVVHSIRHSAVFKQNVDRFSRIDLGQPRRMSNRTANRTAKRMSTKERSQRWGCKVEKFASANANKEFLIRIRFHDSFISTAKSIKLTVAGSAFCLFCFIF